MAWEKTSPNFYLLWDLAVVATGLSNGACGRLDRSVPERGKHWTGKYIAQALLPIRGSTYLLRFEACVYSAAEGNVITFSGGCFARRDSNAETHIHEPDHWRHRRTGLRFFAARGG